MGQSASAQELQIVEAFSSATVPEQVIRESNIKELINGISAARSSVKSTTKQLERARSEQKNGNLLTNWWNDRNDAVQDAQIDLSRTIGHLTEKTSQLLIVNTAISKVLHDQQGILLQQQDQLQHQASALQEQNEQILDQQKALERQQQEINAANKGLMEAKGISQEQARKLVGCVTLVTEAEKRIDAANQELTLSVERYVQDSTAACVERLEELHAGLEQTLQANIQAFDSEIQAQHLNVDRKLECAAQDLERRLDAANQQLELAQQTQREAFSGTLTQMSADLRATADGLAHAEAGLSQMQQALQRSRRAQIIATATAVTVAFAALAWQVLPVLRQAATVAQ
ncbi:hypothetical protein [Bordetella bronchiseptica]|uniref:hypothetical protein n=1 Tax=Bordetella bronchiseptica TaxID=518 RepID=UPI00045A021C|nr:hypothetical protein [Bordetella bronchiseptica]KAK51915.1 hypothetical protein L576_1209 [Bordetella bronchiseptica OSU054]KDB71713.1 hypothetical protein L494_1204 [Bordetella bronchiseptica CA90 BB1334]KDD43863.1 hypothetical protein L532_1207 [Bordetella bronchiseptica OSU095]KDD46396.1 hypothetical protein L529_1201 [Bordetella bronchiseptica MBORD901]